MSNAVGQLESLLQLEALRRRLRRTGLLMLTCESTGRIAAPPSREEDWLINLFCSSPIFHRALQNAAAAWEEQSDPAELEALPGLWLTPAIR